MRVADGRHKGPQEQNELVLIHPLCGYSIQELVQAAVKGYLPSSVDVGIGMGALDGLCKLPRVLD
jgi:hypothetical protein